MRNAHRPRILILSVPHGAGHQRAANALAKALSQVRPDCAVEVVNALTRCEPWFRRYYSSYEILLKYTPRLWAWIDSIQYRLPATGPGWLYRRGGRPLFRFIQSWDPDVVVATEVGMCELAALLKRDTSARFYLIGVCLMDLDRAWAQPEVDLYPVAPGDLALQLEAMGVPSAKIMTCGTPLDPSFTVSPERMATRTRLGVDPDSQLLLVLFGGTGYGKPRQILAELDKVKRPVEVALITGRNQRLEDEVRRLCRSRPRTRVLGWIDNMHEWMAAADLLISKPAGVTLFEAISSGLPFLAFDPLPGNENRNCPWIEKWQVGHWVKRPKDLAPQVERLLANPAELEHLRERALALARPHAALRTAEAILRLVESPG